MMLRLVPASILVATVVGSALLNPAGGSSGASAAGVALNTNGLGENGIGRQSGRTSVDRSARSVASPIAADELPNGKGSNAMSGPRPVERTFRPTRPKVDSAAMQLPINRVTGETSFTGRIIVKLRDELGARAPKKAPTDRVFSTAGFDLSSFDQVLSQFGGSVQSWITHRSDEDLRALELRAEAKSGRGQPDLASFVVVTVQPGRELDAGRALNNLDVVEFVEFERPLVTHQTVVGCDPNNATFCNAPGTTCMDPAAGLMCNPDPGCITTPQICETGCADVLCCELVSGFLEYCNDTESPNGWDVFCAAYANLLCDGTIYDGGGGLPPDQRYDPCFSDGAGAPNPLFVNIAPILLGGCFEPRDGRGCNDVACCFAVCSLDSTCCTIAWDSGCVALAQSEGLSNVCGSPVDPGPTPSFKGELKANPNFPGIGEVPLFAANWQTYLFSEPTLGDFAAPPAPTGDFVFLSSGFRGGGFNLEGVRALQTQFADVYQNGIDPILDGEGIRVGVIEFAAYVNHEDFTLDANGDPLEQPKVILEPGQTPILISGGANDPDHGTACLGQIVAADNGFGVTGIAHRAQGYFFPTLSVEEGSRLPNAMVSAGQTFSDGDVLNFSIGFPGAGPIITSEAVATLIATLTDIGITCVMSAGNDSIPIEPAPFETGAIVVGACWPGQTIGPAPCGQGFFHYCRLSFSNFTNQEENDDGLATVHVAAWGTAITTTGYGDLFTGQNGTDPNDLETNRLRRYTSQFNGTSGAGPMIAGLATVMQGWAKQLYGSPLAPAQIRDVISGNGIGEQCFPLGLLFGPDSPDCNVELGDEVTPLIGTHPDALEVAFAVLNGQFVSGNATEVKIMYGDPVQGSPVSSFRIRATDGNYLKIIARFAELGTQVNGLAYLAGGFTTDVIAFLDAPAVDPNQLQGIALTTVSRSTKPFVVLGGFLFNWEDVRWDFVGVNFIGPGPAPNTFAVNPVLANKYLGPGGQVQARVWTCGLGLVTGHQVWHDLIQVQVTGGLLTP
jgi:hypothetical protein